MFSLSQNSACRCLRRAGFTLIEFSVILVIIGLIAGGVIVGQELMRSSRLQSIAADNQKFQIAINTFRDKYGQLPGDMDDATRFWTQSPGGNYAGGGASYDGTPRPGTFNGNGDGKLNQVTNREIFLFWEHLGLADLIDGDYNGLHGPINSSWDMVPGVSGPTTPVHPLGVWTAREWDYTAVPDFNAHYVTQRHMATNLGHVLILGTDMANFGDVFGVITGEEAKGLDEKIDDGFPLSGKMQSTRREGTGSYRSHCHSATSALATVAQYEYDKTASDYTTEVRMCNVVFPWK